RGRCSYTQTGFAPRAVVPHPNRDSPTPKPGSSRTVGAPAPGAKVLWLDSLFAPRAVLLHPNRVRTEGGAPTSKSGFSYIKTGGPSRTVGAPAPGAKVFWFDSLFAPRAVLLHPNRV